MEGLAGEVSSQPLKPEELAETIPPPPLQPLDGDFEEASVGTPTSAFKKSLAAQVSHIFSEEAEVHLTRDSRGYARSPERVAKRSGEYETVEAGSREPTSSQVASNVELAEGLISMVAADNGEVVAKFNVKEEDAQDGSPRGVWR